MTPAALLTACRLGQIALHTRHEVLRSLWAKFGASVREHRRHRKISLKRFACCLGYTPAMVSMLESGDRQWPMAKAELAVRLLTRPEQWPDGGRDR